MQKCGKMLIIRENVKYLLSLKENNDNQGEGEESSTNRKVREKDE